MILLYNSHCNSTIMFCARIVKFPGHSWEDGSPKNILKFSSPSTSTPESSSNNNDSSPSRHPWAFLHDSSELSPFPPIDVSSDPDGPGNDSNLLRRFSTGKESVEQNDHERRTAIPPIAGLSVKHRRSEVPMFSVSDPILSGCLTPVSLSQSSQDENCADFDSNTNEHSRGEIEKPEPCLHEQVQRCLERLNFDLGKDSSSVQSDVRQPCTVRLPSTDFEFESETAIPILSMQTTVVPIEQPQICYFDLNTATDQALESADHGVATDKEHLKPNLGNNEMPWDRPPTCASLNVSTTRSDPGGSRRDRRRRRAKAKAQYIRDRTSHGLSMPIDEILAARADFPLKALSDESGPKRKHCAFVQEQEFKCLFEDRVGTPHLSEMQPGDEVNAQLNVDELSVGGEVAAFNVGGQTTEGLSILEATDIPDGA